MSIKPVSSKTKILASPLFTFATVHYYNLLTWPNKRREDDKNNCEERVRSRTSMWNGI